MCELLGVSVRPAARLGVYFHEFRPRAEENREGWGIAWWTDGHAEVRKEPIPAHESALAARLADEHPASEMFIVHVRAATVGDLTEANAHPWRVESLGREWVFAHNGTVRDLERLDVGRFVQEGETDSERAFHHLMTRVESLSPEAAADGDRLAAEIHAAGRELSEHDSRVNFLLSDGTTLYAYHDGHKTLHLLEKHADDLGTIDMDDDDYRLALRLGDAPDEHAVIVASVPLTEEPGWERLVPGSFVVVTGGRVVQR